MQQPRAAAVVMASRSDDGNRRHGEDAQPRGAGLSRRSAAMARECSWLSPNCNCDAVGLDEKKPPATGVANGFLVNRAGGTPRKAKCAALRCT